MKKLVAAALTGVLAVSALSVNVFAEDDKTITVGASATPHAEILEQAKPLLEEKGYELEIEVFDDYVLPNEVVDSEEIDANYFQHITYMNQFNEEKGTKLFDAGDIHYEPFGIYPGTKDSLDKLEDGDTIAVPNDTTNEARALLLLQDNGIITLKEDAGLNATINDIEENPHNIEIIELEAAQVARVAEETSFVVLNGNYALQAGLSVAKDADIEENPHNIEIIELEAAQVARVAEETSFVVLNGNYALQAGLSVAKDALAIEEADSEAAKNYVNVIAVKEGNENSEKVLNGNYALQAGLSVAKDALAIEEADSEAAKNYVNVIAVKEGNENSEKIQALVEVLKSDEIKEYINNTYDGAVIPFEVEEEAEDAGETEETAETEE